MTTNADTFLTTNKLTEKPFAPDFPHVVILGAGASIAALPDGDLHSNKIPGMDDLPGILGTCWTDLISVASPPKGDFEFQFSWLRKKGKYENELALVERSVDEYFSSLHLPEAVTIYDYLVLGLRGKDLIATFNWDPFLMQAHRRNREVAELPDIRFLHGSVAFATCKEHDIIGVQSESCPKCNKLLKKSSLIYPDHEKDYTRDSIIYRDWKRVIEALKNSFHLTIYGYSSPKTDYSARRLLLESWNKSPSYSINHVEVIDIKDEEKLLKDWKEFFPHYHSMILSDFWDSSIARWPRRTHEWKMMASLYGIPAKYNYPPRTKNLEEVQKWFSGLARSEETEDNSPKMQQFHGSKGE